MSVHDKYKKYIPVLIGGLIGAAVYIFIYGFTPLQVTNDQWLFGSGDLTQHYVGWKYYRQSPWHFPIGLIDGLMYPNKVSVIYMDAIPLFALLFKLIFPLLPSTFQYFGIFGLFCYFMQGAFAVALLRRASISVSHSLIGSVFFVLSTPMIQRMFGHTSLSAHWLLLAGFYLLLDRQPPKQWYIEACKWGGLLAVAVSIHSYFVPMLGLMFFVHMVAIWLKNRKTIYCLQVLFAGIAVLLITMFTWGMFYGNSDSFSDGGLGYYNANINTLFNSRDNAFFLPELPSATGGQYEGYAYLGFGVLLLLAVAFAMLIYFVCQRRRALALLEQKRKVEKRYVADRKPIDQENLETQVEPLNMGFIFLFSGMLIIFFIIAVSVVVSFNELTLYTIPLPSIFTSILSVFRASGRFMWPIMYALMLIAVYVTSKLINKKHVATIILAACCLIQIVDIYPYIVVKRGHVNFDKTHISKFQASAWNEWGANLDHISFILLEGTKAQGQITAALNLEDTLNLGAYASENHMTLSDFYIARKSTEGISAYQQEQWDSILAGDADENTLYIFPTVPFSIQAGDLLNLYAIDGLVAGTHKSKELAGEYDNCEKIKPGKTADILPAGDKHMSNGEVLENGGRILHKDGVSYGPYLKLSQGRYRVTWNGENLQDGLFNVGTEYTEAVPMLDTINSGTSVSYTIELDSDKSYVEFRCYNTGDSDIVISNLLLESLDENG